MRMGLWNVDLLFMPSLLSLLELLFFSRWNKKPAVCLSGRRSSFPFITWRVEKHNSSSLKTHQFFGAKELLQHTQLRIFFYVSDSFPSFLLISGERPFTSLLENVALKDKKIFKGVVTNKDFETVLGKSTTRIVVALYYPDEEWDPKVTVLLLPDLFVFVNTDILCLLTKIWTQSCQNKLPPPGDVWV